LIHASQTSASEGLIFIALNYRLGALGWLGGPTLQANGTANAGLYDQRLALQWVQDNVHLFGGDKDRVTVIGESAGASSIAFHLTAFGGMEGPVPFAQAITQSTGYIPEPGNVQSEDNLNAFLSLLNVSTLDEARQLPASAIIEANSRQIQASLNGSYTYTPTVDGALIPAFPGHLLQNGQFDHSVKVLTGHNAAEGLFFADPSVQDDCAFMTWLEGVLPNIIPSAASYITNTLYPPIFDGTQGYSSQFERQAVLFGDLALDCNSVFLAQALEDQNYAYEFSVPPGLHTQDLTFTFAFGDKTRAPLNSTVAAALQEYITNFAVHGVPTAPRTGLPAIPRYGSNRALLNLTDSDIKVEKDNISAKRCIWWQRGLFN
jgi:carboxylesterase type B